MQIVETIFLKRSVEREYQFEILSFIVLPHAAASIEAKRTPHGSWMNLKHKSLIQVSPIIQLFIICGTDWNLSLADLLKLSLRLRIVGIARKGI